MSEHPNAAVIRSAYEAIGKADVPAVGAWYESTAGMEAFTADATRCWRS
jgi:hypothetical protein